jgi:4-alpha-glucanotransferase
MPASHAAFRRAAGILLHPTSLAGRHGIGDLGAPARHFVDWLATAGLSIWQILPLCPPSKESCPYVSWAARAGNALLVSLDDLHARGLLDAAEVEPSLESGSSFDAEAVLARKGPRLRSAARRLLDHPEHPLHERFVSFRQRASWADEAAFFEALRFEHGGAPWWTWGEALRQREPSALNEARRALKPQIDECVAIQFFFELQWQALREYGHERGVKLFGDVPIYVDKDSVDVWSNQSLFFLDESGQPSVVSGVPPDYFSETGQLWGNPIYRWDRMAEDDFAWWRARLSRALEQTDVVRIDHFRALSAYWEVPAGAPDARGGRWVRGPGRAFFEAMERHLGRVPLVAEDLGTIDDDVHRLRHEAGLPGMRVLQFAFGGPPDNVHLPHHHTPDNVVYTGTHDNDTTLGFWASARDGERHHARRYLRLTDAAVEWEFIRAAFGSVATWAIIPMQDVLSLGGEARMNDPAKAFGNWTWKMDRDRIEPSLAYRLRDLAELFDRAQR